MLQRTLLIAGFLAPLLYIGTDAIAALQWNGYSYLHQTVSETFAIDAPTRPFIVARGLVYAVLVLAFGMGILKCPSEGRALRIVGAFLIGLGLVDLLGPFAPMHLRGAGRTLTDTMHIALASVDVLFILLSIGFGAAAFGKRFRLYSIVTFIVVLLFGALAGLQGPRIAANEPTPWIGLNERISIFAFMIWMLVLAVTLLRSASARSDNSALE